MIKRLFEQHQPLCATLSEVKKTDLMPSDSEISVMEIFLKVLHPIVEITETLGCEKLVTIFQQLNHFYTSLYQYTWLKILQILLWLKQ